MIKSENYLRFSDYIKQIKSKDCDRYLHYGIKENSSIQIKHLMSIILYTDYTEISYNFSKSFRHIYKNESVESIKKRNSKYFFWSKCLRELVEVYGSDTYPENTNITEFYHGTSYLLFPQMIAKFKGPTSTSSQMEVAAIFSSEKNGIILSLENRPSGVGVEFFNCNFLSAYSNEDESLFIGGRVALQICTIRLLSNENVWQNYSYFVKSLLVLDRAITGNVLIGRKVTRADYKIINALIQQKIDHSELKEKQMKSVRFPDYINELFEVFCNERKVITIDLKYLNSGYPLFKQQLLRTEKADNLLALNNICKIFIQCECVILRRYYGIRKIKIDSKYLLSLLEEISDISCKGLKALKIISPEIEKSVLGHRYQELQKKFKLKQWTLHNIETQSYLGKDKSVLMISPDRYQ